MKLLYFSLLSFFHCSLLYSFYKNERETFLNFIDSDTTKGPYCDKNCVCVDKTTTTAEAMAEARANAKAKGEGRIQGGGTGTCRSTSKGKGKKAK